ncbi:MAG: hypothetical protein B7X82_14500 [Hydrogenophilales bacterium 17-64-65]|nr:MAG: hypothetical protein B7X82_14500 [Hydrogenophilales bacterium 17-64-65]
MGAAAAAGATGGAALNVNPIRNPNQANLDFNIPGDHHDLLHHNQVGTVIVWESQAAKAWHKIEPGQAPAETRVFLEGLSGLNDTYFTVNEFKGWHLQRLLKSLRACFVDIDLGRAATRYDLDEAIERLHEKAMPAPNMVVFSGRGLHLYWILKHTPALVLPVWQAVEGALIKALADFHSDSKARDCTRLLRLVGTKNSKTGGGVRGLVLDGQPWNFHQLTDEVLGHRPERPVRQVRSFEAAQVKRGIHPRATNFRRWHLVLSDLHQIGRHHGQIPEGFRNEFLFLGSVALSWFASPESIADEVIDLAKLYCRGLPEAEAEAAASQSIARAKKSIGGEKEMWQGESKDPRYFFKRETLWERLEPLAAPVVRSLRAIIPDGVAAEHKRECDKARWDDENTGKGYRVGNAEKVAQAQSWRADGMTQREIAGNLGVSQRTISTWLGA